MNVGPAMRSLVRPLGVVLAIPILASVVALYGRSDWDARWSASLVRQLAAQRQRPTPRLLERFSLRVLCAEPRSAARMPACGTYALFSATTAGSVVVAGLGGLFVVSLGAVGRISRKRPTHAMRVLGPALYLAVGGTVLLALIEMPLLVTACCLMASMASGQPVQRLPVTFVLTLASGAVAWAVALIATALSIVRRPVTTVIGRVLDLSTAPALAEAIAGVAVASGARVPRHVIASLAPSLFLVEGRVACLDGALSGRTLCLPLSLCRILTTGELRALVAHEMAHFAGPGAEAATRMWARMAGASLRLAGLARRARGFQAAAVVPPLAIASLLLDGFGRWDAFARERELAADRVAAAVAGRATLATALIKLHAFVPAWQAVIAVMRHAVGEGTRYTNSSVVFAEVVAANTGPGRLRGLADYRLSHPTDSLPPLAERLAPPDLDMASVARAALVTAPAPAAIALVEGHGELEQELTVIEHALLVDGDRG